MRRGTLEDLAQGQEEDAARGEIVVLIDRAPDAVADEDAIRADLRRAMAQGSLKSAVVLVSDSLKVPRKLVYDIALGLKDQS